MNRLYHQLFASRPKSNTDIQDEFTNPNPSNTIETSENDNVSILGSECVAAKKRSKNTCYIHCNKLKKH